MTQSLKEPKQEVALKNLTAEEEDFRALAADSNLLSDEEFQNRKIVPAELDMKQAIQTAQLMCRAKTMLPAHLHGNPGECLAIIMLAKDWGMNPYSVGQATYMPTGSNRVAFTGQLVNAVINKSRKLVMPLRYEYKGEGKNKECTVYGTLYYYDWEDHQLKKEPQERSVTVKMPQNIAKKGKNGSTYYTDKGNSPLWDSDPEQQLAYKAQRFFCRKHMPEILMGVYTGEEVLEMGQQHRPGRDSTETPATNIDKIISEHREEKGELPVKEAEIVEENQDDAITEESLTVQNEAFPGCGTCHGRGIVESTNDESGELTKGPCPECFEGKK
ncbi:MAG: recombinase RecT [Candidatus Anammoxibacter sp.]